MKIYAVLIKEGNQFKITNCFKYKDQAKQFIIFKNIKYDYEIKEVEFVTNIDECVNIKQLQQNPIIYDDLFGDCLQLRQQYEKIKPAILIKNYNDVIQKIKCDMANLLVVNGYSTSWNCCWPQVKIGEFGQLCPKCNTYNARDNVIQFPERFGNRLVMKGGPYGLFWGCEHYPQCDYSTITAEMNEIRSNSHIHVYNNKYYDDNDDNWYGDRDSMECDPYMWGTD